jgi:hypothetical protein
MDKFTEFQCLFVCDALFSGRERVPARDMLSAVLDEYKMMMLGKFVYPSCEKNPIKEVYDFRLKEWSPCHYQSASIMINQPTSIRMANGDILVSGGIKAGRGVTDCCIVSFDQKNNRLTPRNTFSLTKPRFYHTLSLLRDGRILAFGGTRDNVITLDSIEFFDPLDEEWEIVIGNRNFERRRHAAVVLLDGRVMIIGGLCEPLGSDTCMIFDVITTRFTFVDDMSLPRQFPSAVLLPTGDVMVMGGVCGTAVSLHLSNTCEKYNITTGKWEAMPPMQTSRIVITSVYILALHSVASVGTTGACELFSITDNTWSWYTQEPTWWSDGQLNNPVYMF